MDLEIKSYWLKGLNFKIKESVGIDVMADTVHNLPLARSKTSHEPKVTKRMVSHVDEVVSNPQQGENGQTTEN